MKAVESKLPTAALVGRANVGKSTLFNRMTETGAAVISPEAGTTRDRKEGKVLWRGQQFAIVDTGGLDHPNNDEFEDDVIAQASEAINEADVVLFVVDVRVGLTADDRAIAKLMHEIDKPVLVVGNKAESSQTAAGMSDKDWYKLGLEVPRPVSAIRGNGLGDLLDEIIERFASVGKTLLPYEEITEVPRVALVGIPNVGKSSIINEILGEERFITSPVAHTTREPNDTLVKFDDHEYVIIDTAGIRRQSKVQQGIEKVGVRQSLTALKRADIAVLVLDAGKKIDAQEKKLARLIREAGVGCIIALNKWDLVEEKETNTVAETEKRIKDALPHLKFAPLLTISAKERQRIHKLFPLFDTIMKERSKLIPDEELDTFLRRTISKHKPARGKGVAHPTIFRLKQLSVSPPTFELVIKGKRTDVLHLSYLRFLENRLREQYGFTGTPIVFRSIASKKV